jgi:LacI family transcriptional regulator
MRQQGTEIILRTMEHIDPVAQLALIDELEQADISGLALTPAEDSRICDRIDALSEHIPVVTFNTDMPGSRRLCYVGQDNYLSGRTCAYLMNLLLGGTGTVLMITGHLSNFSHQRRIDGFRSEMLAVYPGVSLLPLARCEDSQQVAYQLLGDALTAHPEIRGVYLSAAGPTGVCDLLRERNLLGKVHVICHDATAENCANTRSGAIDFLIDQDAHKQAVRPIEILLDYILTGVRPTEEFQLTHIDIRNRYNV